MEGSDSLWTRYCKFYQSAHLGAAGKFALDISRMRFENDWVERMRPAMERAFDGMEKLEHGAVANIDETRQVGHFWLRDTDLAPTDTISSAICKTNAAIREFAREVHGGKVQGADGSFKHLLHIGIGGSALGPQLVARALGGSNDRLRAHYLDNTDPDGIDSVLAAIGGELGRTLVTVVSKSGGTPEPRNGMLEVQSAYKNAQIAFVDHAVAITMEGSKLDRDAKKDKWLRRFSLWDWVGGRTSVTSAVGLLPAALQGYDIDAFLDGAAAMDRLTRCRELLANPAALLALMWFKAGDGRGAKDMVILPYCDRLELFSRYLQQLVMESLGKEKNRANKVVHQGLAVYGNKGSTDQHAYVQQLRDGIDNFFVTFVEVLHDREGESIDVGHGATSGDYLHGFLQGTRRALYESGRDSMTLTLDRVSPASLGALIALYERAVGLYAELIDINAYHQPGVEAGKKAANDVLELQRYVTEHLAAATTAETAEQIATQIAADHNVPREIESVYKILEHLAANGRVESSEDEPPADRNFRSK